MTATWGAGRAAAAQTARLPGAPGADCRIVLLLACATIVVPPAAVQERPAFAIELAAWGTGFADDGVVWETSRKMSGSPRAGARGLALRQSTFL